MSCQELKCSHVVNSDQIYLNKVSEKKRLNEMNDLALRPSKFKLSNNIQRLQNFSQIKKHSIVVIRSSFYSGS